MEICSPTSKYPLLTYDSHSFKSFVDVTMYCKNIGVYDVYIHKLYISLTLNSIMAKESEGKLIGEISSYFQHVKAAAIKLTAPLSVGDKVKIIGGEKKIEITIESMQIDRKPVQKAKKGDEIGILVPEDVPKGYRIYKL